MTAFPQRLNLNFALKYFFLMSPSQQFMFTNLTLLLIVFSLCQMGCYGLGVSRILAAVVEHTVQTSPNRLKWSRGLAPYSVCIVPLNDNTKVSTVAPSSVCMHTYFSLKLFTNLCIQSPPPIHPSSRHQSTCSPTPYTHPSICLSILSPGCVCRM